MKITKLNPRHVTTQAFKDITGLLVQLRSKKLPGTRAELMHIASNRNVVVLMLQDGARIIGLGSLYVIQKVGERVAHLEDVVVDEAYRGQGWGKKLMHALITEARKKKVYSIDLTSRPARVVANNLYQRLGFEKRETNVYRLKL